jgi:hypothetical protein
MAIKKTYTKIKRIYFMYKMEYSPTALLRKLRWWYFNRKLKRTALFIEKHNLYPVQLNKELLVVWKKYDRNFLSFWKKL